MKNSKSLIVLLVLFFINGLAIGWLIFSVMSTLSDTKQVVKDTLINIEYKVLHNCKTEIVLHLSVGPICLKQGEY